VVYRDRLLHIATWAAKFLFTKDQLRTAIGTLSGGEQARVHIARLMLEPADVLILDEPTNDLDLASLEVLEESLEEFPGAVVLVTHDRAMLDRLATRVLALDGRGGARYYADFAQWQRLGHQQAAPTLPPPTIAPPPPPSAAAAPKKRLSYKEQQELQGIEPAIEKAEADLKHLEIELGSEENQKDHRKLAQVGQQMADTQSRLATLYARWQELEDRK